MVFCNFLFTTLSNEQWQASVDHSEQCEQHRQLALVEVTRPVAGRRRKANHAPLSGCRGGPVVKSTKASRASCSREWTSAHAPRISGRK